MLRVYVCIFVHIVVCVSGIRINMNPSVSQQQPVTEVPGFVSFLFPWFKRVQHRMYQRRMRFLDKKSHDPAVNPDTVLSSVSGDSREEFHVTNKDNKNNTSDKTDKTEYKKDQTDTTDTHEIKDASTKSNGVINGSVVENDSNALEEEVDDKEDDDEDYDEVEDDDDDEDDDEEDGQGTPIEVAYARSNQKSLQKQKVITDIENKWRINFVLGLLTTFAMAILCGIIWILMS